MKAIVFDRVSSSEQKEGQSLEAQRKGNSEYAKQNKLKIVKAWSVDESASKEEDRKIFFQAVEYLRENNIKHILFDKVDRCCRGFKAAVLIETLFEKEDVTFHFTRQNLVIHKESPAHDKTQLYFHIMFAKIYVENLKGEIKKGSNLRLEKGLWNYKAPYGYKNVRDTKNQASVSISEQNADAIRKAFTLYATGNYTISEIAEFLFKTCNKKISHAATEILLSNPFYYGMMRIKGELHKGVHQPAIDKALYDKCQRVRGARAKHRVRGNGSRVLKPLMNLMSCGVCGHAVTGEAKVKTSGKTYVYYHCANRKCAQKKICTNQDKIYVQIIEAFKPLSKFTPKATKRFIGNIEKSWTEAMEYCDQETKELREAKLKLKEQIEKLRELEELGVFTKKEIESKIKLIESKLDSVDLESSAHLKAETSVIKQGLRVIELMQNAYDYMSLDGDWLEKINLVKMVVSNPTLKDGKLCFTYEKPFDTLIENLTLKNWWGL